MNTQAKAIHTQPATPHQHALVYAAISVLAALLSACGGGGDASPTATSTGASAAVEQGRWISTTTAPGYTAIVQHKANAATSLWMLANDASVLAQLNLSGSGTAATSGSATGKLFTLGSTNSTAIAGNFNANSKTLTLSQVLSTQTAALELTANDAMVTALTPALAAGSWNASATGLTVNWRINSSGAISGTSTTGCTYSGQLSAPASIGLYEASFTEVCAGTSNTFAGIATLNPGQAQMTVVASTADAGKGTALFFGK